MPLLASKSNAEDGTTVEGGPLFTPSERRKKRGRYWLKRRSATTKILPFEDKSSSTKPREDVGGAETDGLHQLLPQLVDMEDHEADEVKRKEEMLITQNTIIIHLNLLMCHILTLKNRCIL